MARRVRVPLLADLILVDRLEELQSMDSDARIDRGLVPRGPWLNRLLQRRLTHHVRAKDGPLPAFKPRGDAERRASQAALEQRLSSLTVDTVAKDPAVQAIADWIRDGGRGRRSDLAVPVQGLVGRLFDPDYSADRKSDRAGRTIDRYLRTGPLRGALLVASGRLGRAVRLIGRRAADNATAMHATSIAYHNIVAALVTMKDLYNDPNQRCQLRETTVAAQCLTAPRAVQRVVSERTQLPDFRLPVRPGALVLYRLKKATKGRADTAAMFRTGDWSQCPAHVLVPRVMQAVWRRLDEGGPRP